MSSYKQNFQIDNSKYVVITICIIIKAFVKKWK